MGIIESINSTNKQILNSGIIYLFNDDDNCIFNLIDKNGSNKIKILFDTNNDKERIYTNIKNDVLEIHCVNFNINGTGTKKAILIGSFEVDNEKYNLYIQFWASKHSEDSSWKIEYTFYAEVNLES